MASIATTCSSGLIFRAKESSSNVASIPQFNGLRAVDGKQVASFGSKSNGSISTSGLLIFSLLQLTFIYIQCIVCDFKLGLCL